MTFILAMVTILSTPMCGPQAGTLSEDLKFEKPASAQVEEKFVYKKIPTKWVKTTKKSN